MQGVKPDYASPPSDPSDFGRCYRLLKLIPEWRPRLSEVAARYRQWTALIEHWDELTAMYEDELENGPKNKFGSRMAPRTYDRMKVLIDEGRIAAGWKRTGPGSWQGPSEDVVEITRGVSFKRRTP